MNENPKPAKPNLKWLNLSVLSPYVRQLSGTWAIGLGALTLNYSDLNLVHPGFIEMP